MLDAIKRLLGLARKREAPAFDLPDDAACKTTASGLKVEVLEPGDGSAPGPADRVTVHYAGWLVDGTPFDSSYARGRAATFGLDRVIAGWREGLQMLEEGGSARLVVPPGLAYGRRGAPPVIGPDATLVFHVELLRVG